MAHGIEHGNDFMLFCDANTSPVNPADVHLTIVLNEDVGLNQKPQDLRLDLFGLIQLGNTAHDRTGG